MFIFRAHNCICIFGATNIAQYYYLFIFCSSLSMDPIIPDPTVYTVASKGIAMRWQLAFRLSVKECQPTIPTERLKHWTGDNWNAFNLLITHHITYQYTSLYPTPSNSSGLKWLWNEMWVQVGADGLEWVGVGHSLNYSTMMRFSIR